MAFFLSYSCDICLRDSSSWLSKKNTDLLTITSMNPTLFPPFKFYGSHFAVVCQTNQDLDHPLKGMQQMYRLLVLFCTLNTLEKQVPKPLSSSNQQPKNNWNLSAILWWTWICALWWLRASVKNRKMYQRSRNFLCPPISLCFLTAKQQP